MICCAKAVEITKQERAEEKSLKKHKYEKIQGCKSACEFFMYD